MQKNQKIKAGAKAPPAQPANAQGAVIIESYIKHNNVFSAW